MIESFEAATTISRSENSSCWNVGLRTHFSWMRPMRVAAIGPANGILEAFRANEA